MDLSNIHWPSLFPYVVVGIIVLSIAFKIVSAIRDRKRREANAELAAARGFDYRDEDPTLISLGSDDPFNHGFGRRALGAVRGTYRGRDFVSFTYTFYTESRDSDGDTSRSYHYYVVTAIDIGAQLPLIKMTPESWGDSVAKAFGARDLEVESAAFNDRWLVWTKEERIAHAILAPDMIAQLLKPEYEDFPLIIELGRVYTYSKGKQDLTTLDARLDPLVDFLDEIPDFVLADHRS